jgi:glycosyltransferase involved in cell wall biosynthesis
MTVSPEKRQRPRSQTAVPVLESEAERPWVSIVLPAHNEALVIGAVAQGFLAAAEGAGRSAEVIIVDDGSHDGTAQVVRDIAAVDSRVRLVHRPRCGGYGKALTDGFDAADGEWVFFTDGDGQFGAEPFEGFLARAAEGDVDVIAGYRHPRSDPMGRRLLGKTWSSLVRGAFRVRARDINCAFKLIRGDALASMGLTSAGALINAEIFHKARRAGLRVVELPVSSHRPREVGTATGAKPQVIGLAVVELVKYRLGTLWGRR